MGARWLENATLTMANYMQAQRAGPSFGAVLAAACFILFSSTLANAQLIGISVSDALYPPTFQSTDENGVDLISGKISLPYPALSIGVPGQSGMVRRGLSYPDYIANAPYDSHPIRLKYFHYAVISGDPPTNVFVISGGGFSGTFEGLSPIFNDGSSLGMVNNKMVYTSRQGEVITFSSSNCSGTPYCPGGDNLSATSRTTPTGEIITYNGPTALSNAGWMLKYDYNGSTLAAITALNTASEPNYCSIAATQCQYQLPWPSLTYSYSGSSSYSIKDALGNTYSLPFTPVSGATTQTYSFAPPMGATITIVMDDLARVLSYNNGTSTWTYSYSDSVSQVQDEKYGGPYTANPHTVTVVDPNGHTQTVSSSTALGRVNSYTDEIGRTTSISYDSSTGKVSQIIHPEGNQDNFKYDGRGNLIQTTHTPKPNSSLANIVITAGYDATCEKRGRSHLLTARPSAR